MERTVIGRTALFTFRCDHRLAELLRQKLGGWNGKPGEVSAPKIDGDRRCIGPSRTRGIAIRAAADHATNTLPH